MSADVHQHACPVRDASSQPDQFSVLPDHVYQDVENVVRETERFFVVCEDRGGGDDRRGRGPARLALRVAPQLSELSLYFESDSFQVRD